MIIKDKPQDLINYLEDTSNLKGCASRLYIPQNKSELIQAIEACRKSKTSITLSAGRTGTTAGSTPLSGAVISCEKLNKTKIDSSRQSAYLEAGVTLQTLEEGANKSGLSLRASPTESLACIGGVISTCASGVRGFRYGSIRNYVKRIEVILTSGEALSIERGHKCNASIPLPSYSMPKVKSQAGYFIKDDMDLIDLFIGSEGTLGVIASCEVALQKLADCVFDGIIFFPDELPALSFVKKIKQLKKDKTLNPTSLEFFDQNSLEFLRPEYSFIQSGACAVYFEQEVEGPKEEEALINTWADLASGSHKTIFADTPKLRKKVFEFRHRLPQLINEFLRQNNQVKAATDIAVPDDKFGRMYAFYKQGAGEAGIDYVNFGHIGESHLHFNFLPRTKAEAQKARKFMELFCRKAVSLGGTISAEHGIGKIKKPYLRLMYSQKEIEEMATLKKYFDPDCLLNLDNIFGKALLSHL